MLPHAALAAVALAYVLAPAVAHAQGIPEWSQFQGGPGHPGFLQDGPAPPYRLAWTFRAPEGGLSGAVIAGDVAIAVGRTAVFGIDLATGKLRWQLIRNGGPLSIPAVGTSGNRRVLVFVDQSDFGTYLVGVDLSDRREVWRTRLKTASRSGVTADGATAFVADDDGNVYAVDLATGGQRWRAKAIGEVLVPPAASEGKVYVAARDANTQKAQLLALDEASGQKAWEFSPQVAGSAVSGPAAAEGSVVAGFADRVVRSFAADGGAGRWSALGLSLFSPASSAAFQPGNVYIADVGGGLYRLNSKTGAREWDYQLNELVVRSSPVLSGRSVLLGLNDGRLVGIDVASGELVWQSAPSPGLIGAIALSHQMVVVVKGGRRAGLLAFEHDPTGKLVHIPSPTEVDPAKLFANYAIALVLVALILFIPFRLLSSRVGPPVRSTEEGEREDGG